MRVTIELTEEQRRHLAEVAERLNVPAERLAEAAVRDLVARSDDAFEDVAKRLLEKNRELYERLA